MSLRESLINSAVVFLRDPNVANAPLEKKIAFLQAKNLSQLEIDAALSRSTTSPTPSSPTNIDSSSLNSTFPPKPFLPPLNHYDYYSDSSRNFPKRDWRDWFIMATVLSSFGYGLYVTAKRYIVPLIKPPTPSLIEQDKAEIKATFDKAFTLLDQLASETAAIKASEDERKVKLDTILTQLETTISNLNESESRRYEESRKVSDELKELRDLIPRSVNSQRELAESRFTELSQELKSFKTLFRNRLAAGTINNTTNLASRTVNFSTPNSDGTHLSNGIKESTEPNAISSIVEASISDSGEPDECMTNGITSTSTPQPHTDLPPSDDSSAGIFTFLPSRFVETGKVSIPAWQLAAKNA